MSQLPILPPSAPPPSAQSSPQARRKKRKPLNISLIKSAIVLVIGFLTAVGSAVTGLGAQVAFAPMLSWMLGFTAEKALAAALRYAVITSLGVVVSAFVQHQTPSGLLLRGFMLFFGATIGAVLTAKLSPKPQETTKRSLYLSIGMFLTMLVIIQTTRQSWLDSPHFATWNTPLALLALGGVVGMLTQAMGLASGILLFPALYYLGGFSAHYTVLLSLLVVALASLLPSWSYAQKGLVDTSFGNTALVGGLLGGLAGGWILTRVPEKGILYLFAVIAMFLCAKEMSRLSEAKPPQAPPA